jgi:sRNA-binding protein
MAIDPSREESQPVNVGLLPELRKRYPKAFATDPAAVMPLMLKVHEPLILAGYGKKAVRAALCEYVSAPAYLESLAVGKPRIDLDGEPAGIVSEKHQALAKAWLESPEGRPPLSGKKPKRPAVALSGTIEQHQEPSKKKAMSTIELTGTQAKIAITIDADTFRATLDLDTAGAKAVPVAIVVDGKKYTAQLNSKSFRKAQAMFREAANPTVSISGNLKGNAIEAAGIVVFDKGAKPATEAGASSAPTPEPTPVMEPQGAATANSETGRPKLALKPKGNGNT